MTTAQDETKRILIEAREAVRRIQDEVNEIYGLMAGELGEVDGLSGEIQVMAVDFATTTSAWFEDLDLSFGKLCAEVIPANEDPKVVSIHDAENSAD